MRNNRKLALTALGLTVAIGAWAAFRPEKLFINEKVNETLPITAGTKAETLSSGTFASYAHETTGKAEVIVTGGKRYLRLSNFKTSNGPDVHVYLVKGDSSTDESVSKGAILDLGVIKGNEGDQNYELPAGSEDGYGAVSIWCKRFSVGFGGATLKAEAKVSYARPASQVDGGFRLAAWSSEVLVTSGKLSGGKVAIMESAGARNLRLTGVKGKPNLRVLLVKMENPGPASAIIAAEKLDLGALGTGKSAYKVSKSIDAWLFRTVVLWDVAKKQPFASAPLRSPQEKNRA